LPADEFAAPAADRDLLTEAAREAGALALGFFRNSPEVWTKANDSPVSEADLAVDRMLAARLRAARPDYGWLSEETEDDPARLDCRRAFVLDPIDGTREFLAGRPDWCVSLAVVEDGTPVAAALFVPVLGRMFTAAFGAGATLDGHPAAVSGRQGLMGARLAGPRRPLRLLAEAAGVVPSGVRFVGALAYRMALVAAGEVEIAFGREGAHDWDLAAADLIVHEAGGMLIDLAGERLRYNRAGTVQPGVLAANPRLAAEAAALLQADVAVPAAGVPA